MKRTKGAKEKAIQSLRETLNPGDTVYTILKHVSSSGMSRQIGVTAIKDNEPLWLSYLVAQATGERWNDKREALSVQGCGMDMGFHVVYNLSATLFPKGFGCVGKNDGHGSTWCPSNDHSNGDRDYTRHGCFDENSQPEDRDPTPGEVMDGCKRHWHNDGGYALRHRWL